jgi:hypothetical protein
MALQVGSCPKSALKLDNSYELFATISLILLAYSRVHPVAVAMSLASSPGNFNVRGLDQL